MPQNILTSDEFSLSALTSVAQQIPPAPSVLGDLGIFNEKPIDTLSVTVEYMDGLISLVDPTPRGGAGETTSHAKRKMVSFPVPHFQRDDHVSADEVSARRAFGSPDQMETVMGRIADKIARHKNDLDLTLEYQRIGAISGKLTNKAGEVYTDLFSSFGISEPSAIGFALGTDTTDVRAKAMQVMDTMSDALDIEVGGDAYPITALCGSVFWEKLIGHSAVKDTYKNWEAAAALRGDGRKPFEFGGIRWVRYRTTAKVKAAKNNSPLIPDNTARFVVAGIPELYNTYFAPADYNETVNTLGEPIYAKVWPAPNDKGFPMEVQRNCLSICTRPAALIRATA